MLAPRVGECNDAESRMQIREIAIIHYNRLENSPGQERTQDSMKKNG